MGFREAVFMASRQDRTSKNAVRNSLKETLEEALRMIDRPGTFCVSGTVPTVLPGLELTGLGPVGLPLSGSQAKELKGAMRASTLR